MKDLPTYKQLAEELNVSEQAVKQYPKNKRELMLHGLKAKKIFLDDYEKTKPVVLHLSN